MLLNDRLTVCKSHSNTAGSRREDTAETSFSYVRIDTGTRSAPFIRTVPAPSTWLLSCKRRIGSLAIGNLKPSLVTRSLARKLRRECSHLEHKRSSLARRPGTTSTTNCTRPASSSKVARASSSTHCSVNRTPPDAEESDAEDIIASKYTVEVALRNCPGVKLGSRTGLKLPLSIPSF